MVGHPFVVFRENLMTTKSRITRKKLNRQAKKDVISENLLLRSS